MVRLCGKKQRRKKKGINDIGRIYACVIKRFANIFYVVVENIMPTDELGAFKKLNKFDY